MVRAEAVVCLSDPPLTQSADNGAPVCAAGDPAGAGDPGVLWAVR